MFFTLALVLALGVALFVIRRQVRALTVAEQRRVADLAAQRETFEDARLRDQARMDALLDAMIEGLVVIDAARRIVLANRAAEKLFHFSRMMAGGSLLEAVRHHEVATLARRAVVEDAPIEHEVRVEGPEARILQVSAVALRDRDGSRNGAILVFHDVTRLRQLESVRQDFVANVSHELRTPLSLIRSAAETLLDGAKDDPAVAPRFLQMIDTHVSRLTVLIDDLLLLARLDSGHVQLDLTRLAVRSAVQEAIDDAAPVAQGRQVRLENTVAPGLEAQADPARLRQVLGNLIENALKYGKPAGTITLGARAISSLMVEVWVRDDGPGIPLEAQSRIFERFFRLDKGRSREQGGTGLGLAIVKNVVQAHGGDVRVESSPGHGATFRFTLPAA